LRALRLNCNVWAEEAARCGGKKTKSAKPCTRKGSSALRLDQMDAPPPASGRGTPRAGARSGDILTSSHWLKRDMLYVKIQ